MHKRFLIIKDLESSAAQKKVSIWSRLTPGIKDDKQVS